jgi:hypothetical protein
VEFRANRALNSIEVIMNNLTRLKRALFEAVSAYRGINVYFNDTSEPEGAVKSFRGLVYHGTDDWRFLEILGARGSLGRGSHLTSLNDGDALSVTPKMEVALEFARSGLVDPGIVVEMQADLTIYYASRQEDDLDDINPPAACDAVAIPLGAYEEHEIAILRLTPTNLQATAVIFLEGGTERVRVPVTYRPGDAYDAEEGYILEFFKRVLGNELDQIADLLDARGNIRYVKNNRGLRVPNFSSDYPIHEVLLVLAHGTPIIKVVTPGDKFVGKESKRFYSAKDCLDYLGSIKKW